VSSQLAIDPAVRVTLEIPTAQIAALQAGAPDGEPVLLVPGFTGSKEDFGPIMRPLAQAGYRATAIDMRGQYESPGHGNPAEYTVEALGSDVAAVAASLGGGVHVVGHSFGGLVSRAAVIGGAPFASLTLMASGPAGIDGGRRARMHLLRPVLAQHGVAAVYDAMVALDATDPAVRSPELQEFLRRRFLAGDPAMLLGMGDALIDEPDRVAELVATGLRVLVIYGTDDDAWPPAVQARMAERLGAAHVEVPAAAHAPAVENPDFTVASLISFWRSG
jgi:pimeloyl-ACP methyl ester carboxylesterase